jgi:ubiquinone biosynthesis protein
LGVTYIKLGQFLALRFDILPWEVCEELGRLFDSVPPMPAAAVRKALETEFLAPIEVVFRTFEWTPIAAASIAQVHHATTHDGDEVAVKVRRVDAATLFAADVRILQKVALLLDWFGAVAPHSLDQVLAEFARFTNREMDFLIEGNTAEEVRRNAGPSERVPKIYWNLTRRSVLTMEFIQGRRLSDVLTMIEGHQCPGASAAPDRDIARGIRNLAYACLRQLFVTGLFLADPHPGNIFLTPENSFRWVRGCSPLRSAE